MQKGPKLRHRLRGGFWPLVGALAGHGVKGVSHGDHPGFKGDLVPLNPVWVAGAVQLFVVALGNAGDLRAESGFKQPAAVGRVAADETEFLFRQAAGLVVRLLLVLIAIVGGMFRRLQV